MVRLVSGAVMAAVALAAIFHLPQTAFRVAVSVLSAAAAWEFAPLSGRRAGVGRWLVVLVAALSTWVLSEQPFSLPLASVVVLSVAAGFVLGQGRMIPTSLAAPFALLYLGVPFACVASLRATAGPHATVLLVATIVVSDSLQYYTGRLFGRRPLAPKVSPKKTVEGAIGGVVAAGLFLAVAGPAVLPQHSATVFGVLGLVLAFVGIVGDLFESQLKRTSGVKDSSHLIPGHGGVLDRVDALVFVVPVFYLFVRGSL